MSWGLKKKFQGLLAQEQGAVRKDWGGKIAFALARIPLRAGDRRPHDPLVLMGGVCAFSNPEPVAPFMDLIVVGEGEELVGELIAAYRDGYDDRDRLLDTLATIEGVYVPSRYEVSYALDGTVGEVLALDAAPAIVTK